MENYLRTEREKMQAMKPTLSDCNDTAPIIVEQLRRTGASTYRILEFLDELYKPLGVELLRSGEFDNVPHTFTALQIAYICGMYSLYGLPHAQAVSCILNEHLLIDDGHKIIVSDESLDAITGRYRYDMYALKKVQGWLNNLGYPNSVYSAYPLTALSTAGLNCGFHAPSELSPGDFFCPNINKNKTIWRYHHGFL